MIKIPAEKLAAAVNKHLLPGIIRSLSKKTVDKEENRKSS